MSFTGLLVPPDELVREVDHSSLVCSGAVLSDFDDWERLLIEENDPENWGFRNERQNMNDCQGNALTGGVEVIQKNLTGRVEQLARKYAYQWSEYYDGNLGKNRGSTIHSGVKVATQLGIPLEAEYPYDRYTRKISQLRSWTSEVQSSASTRKIAGHISAPPWEMLLPYIVTGNPLHWGTYWPLKWDSDRVVRKYRRNHGRGGHATVGVWVVKTRRGEFLLKVANSHGDGYFYVSEDAYEEMRDRRYSPYGAYILQGPEKPFEKFLFV